MDDDRAILLARVAKLYYLDNLSQHEIAAQVGISRSAISRILTEARRSGIVEIRVHQPLQRDEALEQALQARFGLQHASVVNTGSNSTLSESLEIVGQMAAALLARHLAQISILGISWGTAVAATVEALPLLHLPELQVVQIIGAAGSANNMTDTPDLAVRAARKLGSQFQVLSAPMFVENATVANSLLSNRTVAEALNLASRTDIALVGIGSTDPSINSVIRAGYATREYIEMLLSQGVVGDVCGLYFDMLGNFMDVELHQRRIGISQEWLTSHHERVIGVAVGEAKIPAILGALNGRLIGTLVTDKITAECLLR
jgi:deoxyribonucleoside regulator